jgi:alkaline phosphatase
MPDGTTFYVNWSTIHHTPSDVPVTAQGPSSELLMGRYENTLIFAVMRASLGKKSD